MESPPRVGTLKFGDCELDLGTGELRRGDQVTALGGLPARLLGLLAWNHRALTTRDEIQRALWPDGTTVEFDQSINQHVRQLRHALGDSAARPVWIQTLPARGYRFLVEAHYAPRPGASPAGAAAAPVAPDAPAAVAPRPAPRRRPWWIVLAAPLALAAVCTLVASGSAPPAPPREPAGIRIAVLPFTADEPASASRADGLTEDVITAIGETYAPGLEAIALRTMLRYRDRPTAEAALAGELDVAYVVEGRVRSHADRTRISVRLVRARDAAQLWARTFDQADAAGWGVEAAIAQDVAATLGRLLLRPFADEPAGSAARDALLRGRTLQHQRRPRLAALAFAEAIVLAPRSGRAWAGLAAVELQAGDDRGFAAAARTVETALALDPAQPEANFVRATLALYVEWDAERACRHYAAAIRANPAYAEAHHAMAGCYAAAGRHDEAIAAMARARALDPLAPEVVSDVGWYYYFARRFDDAAAWCARTLQIEPRFYWAHRCLVLARAAGGDRRGAIAAAVAALDARGAGAAARDAAGRQVDPVAVFWRIEADQPDEATDLSDRAGSRVMRGDLDGALDDLERAVEVRRGWLLPFLAVAPMFDALRDAPRFARVLARVRAGASPR